MTRKHPEAKKPFRQPDGRGPNGRGRCRWCWGEVAPYRQTFCSDACVEEYRLECDWGFARSRVFNRDGGVCAMCEADTKWLQEIVRHMRAAWRTDPNAIPSAVWVAWARRMPGGRSCGSPWEADHILPRHDGGSDHPDNLRTLCIPCHQRVTREFAAERARRRRDANAALFAETEGA